jgi:hypothetical protein
LLAGLLWLDFDKENKMNRLQLIKNAVKVVQSENKNSFKGIERQVIMLTDREYVNKQKDVDTINELDFNS